MIHKNIGIGEIFITDASFGHVGVGQKGFAEHLNQVTGAAPDHIVWMDQIHSPTVEFVDQVNGAGMILQKTDGVMTNQSGALLITKTADCVPILLWNEREKTIAALHCGWRGFLAGIIGSFAKLCQQRGLRPEQFTAFLGPHLRVDNFEVQQDFLDALAAPHRHLLIQREGKSFFDITRGVFELLESTGIHSIEDCGIDTFSSPEYFSYRRWFQVPEGERPKNYNTFASCIILT